MHKIYFVMLNCYEINGWFIVTKNILNELNIAFNVI